MRVSLELLTHSRMSSLRTCPRKHYLAYELGVRRDQDAAPLRMGQAVHVGLDRRAVGAPVAEAILSATAGYDIVPSWTTPEEWELEREIVARLIAGYYWHYDNETFENITSEIAFELPLRNPKGGRPSRTFNVAGVIDRIVRLPEGRLAVLETKTTSDDIGSDSEYWLRLRLDQQISLYVLAARELGYDVETVIYDVIRKPSIRPKQVTVDGRREINANKTYCKEAIDPEKLSLGRETPAMFGARLLSDIAERPEFYFQRKEIPRLEADLDEFRSELWQQAKVILESRRENRWYRNSAACLNPPCAYRDICFHATHVGPESETPPGYVRLKPESLNPELEGRNRVHCNPCETTAQSLAAESNADGGGTADAGRI